MHLRMHNMGEKSSSLTDMSNASANSWAHADSSREVFTEADLSASSWIDLRSSSKVCIGF